MNRQWIALSAVVLSFTATPVFAHNGDVTDQRPTATNGPWQQINVPATVETTVRGEHRTLKPGCAHGGPYSFFYRAGDPSRLLIYLDGGGSCWSDHTCVTSLTVNMDPSLYDPVIDADDLPRSTGAMDNEDPNNPFAGWTIVYLPYCTADVHWGSKDTTYEDLTGLVTGVQGGEFTVQHRGFDNVLAVRHWMRQNLNRDTVNKVFISGSSAGAYGAVLAYPVLRPLFRNARAGMLADGGSGIITQSFYDAAVVGEDFTSGNWGIDENLPWNLYRAGLLAEAGPDYFNTVAYAVLGFNYPHDRFAQYSTAWDGLQTLA
mgnify:CR=1 FL=1